MHTKESLVHVYIPISCEPWMKSSCAHNYTWFHSVYCRPNHCIIHTSSCYRLEHLHVLMPPSQNRSLSDASILVPFVFLHRLHRGLHWLCCTWHWYSTLALESVGVWVCLEITWFFSNKRSTRFLNMPTRYNQEILWKITDRLRVGSTWLSGDEIIIALTVSPG